ncbi:hypothetical protein OG948_24880 [Embleya sp. NBC_00888]|uniref:hypothetical protein n=1 Tax=Embleya sp. NBC_00888 TaxID=2975960 RepID=UPI003863A7FC|nr:hypothetical protein OG948_24880 [Embleya sp. NBC_00888]
MNPSPPDLDDPDDAVHELRTRLRDAEAACVEPPGLAVRVLRRPAPRSRWRGTFAIALAAVLVPAVVGFGAFLVGRHDASDAPAPRPPAARAASVQSEVHNSEVPCRALRTLECSMGVFKEPKLSSRTADLADRVWHGDRLLLVCLLTDGPRVTDETGVASRHWYRVVVLGTNAEGWLPGVRTRNETEVPDCAL